MTRIFTGRRQFQTAPAEAKLLRWGVQRGAGVAPLNAARTFSNVRAEFLKRWGDRCDYFSTGDGMSEFVAVVFVREAARDRAMARTLDAMRAT
jgi:hypothetical protein